MHEFEIKDMTCGHCVQQVTRAIAASDRKAQVKIDLAAQIVRVESTASEAELRQALIAAGYPAT